MLKRSAIADTETQLSHLSPFAAVDRSNPSRSVIKNDQRVDVQRLEERVKCVRDSGGDELVRRDVDRHPLGVAAGEQQRRSLATSLRASPHSDVTADRNTLNRGRMKPRPYQQRAGDCAAARCAWEAAGIDALRFPFALSRGTWEPGMLVWQNGSESESKKICVY